MKSRFLIFSLLLLMFVVGISAISAEDISDMGEISSDEVTDDVISVDDAVTDVSTSDDEGISDGEPTRSNTYTWGDFKSEVEDANVNTVKLNQSNIAPSSDSSDQISINHDITIVGGYGYYIGNADWNSATSYNYIPMITSGNNLNVNFENVTFQYLSNNIFIKLMGNGNFAFKNCVFNNINCTGDHQSVIWLNYGYALIENCTFTNVTSSFGAVTNYYSSWGTAVNNARMTVKGSTFKDNYATTEPGAINNCGKLEVYDSTFENNEAVWWAGAIHTHSNANTTIVRSNFRNNIAGWNGGALYSYSYLTVINSTFIANEAHQTSGGAIAASAYGSRPTVVIENCDFDENTATGSGGAISFSGTSLTVENSRFNDNAARSGTGGAISSAGTTVNINNCNFTKNNASGRGGAVYASGTGYLNVYYSNFVNNIGSEGNDIAYYYTTKKNNAAFLNYDYDEFWGEDNASGSIYAYNTQYLVVNSGNHNQFHDIDEYVTPIDENSTNDNNDTNSSTNFIPIPEGTTIGSQLWNASLDGALGGTPLINGDYIYVPNGHNVYCYNINTGALLWNVSSQWGYFHELALHNNVIIAPCSWDKLYFIDATTGALIQNESNIYQGSSIYAPLVVGDMIYISSEYSYDGAWIAVIEYVDGEYVYICNILEIYDVPYGEQGLLSEPVIGEDGNIWVNTRNGIMYLNPDDWHDYNIILNGTVGKPVVSEYGIYILNQNNKVYIISYDNYMTGSLDINNGVGNSLSFDEDVLVMVCADGTILRISNDFWILDSFQINPVSSNIYAKDNYLCIGDDAGILWVFGDYISPWAFNATSPILKTPTVHNDIVFIGTNDTFYALYDPSFMNLNSNVIPLKYNFKSNNLLKISNNDLLLDSSLLNHVYVTNNGNGDGSSFENAMSLENAIKNVQSNSIIHIADGEYTISSANIQVNNKQNITIQAENFGKVNISINKALTFNGFNNFTIKGLNFKYSIKALTFGLFKDDVNKIRFSCSNIYVDSCSFDGLGRSVNAISPSAVRNFTISNCNFTNSKNTFIGLTTSPADYSTTSMPFTYTIVSDANINITNCEFTKCSNIPLTLSGTTGNSGDLEVIVNYYIENCKFLNNTGKNSISITATTKDHKNFFNIINNYFESNNNNPAIIAKGGILTFEKNNFSFDYAIQLDSNSKVVSPLTFRIFNNESVKVSVNESVDLIGELVDDKGNRIYHSGLKLDVNGSEKSPTFNPDNGLYVLSFTPENIGELPIDVECNLLDDLSADIFNLIVSGNPNLTVSCNDSIYGEPFNVNVNLNDAVSGENVTFSIVDSAGNVIKSTNSKIDNAFASASFEYMSVGDYTVKVTYDGDENFASSTVSKTFSISKANSTVQIIVNQAIPVGDDISVQAVLPANAVGNVTFRLNNINKTVNATDNAIFDGLSEGIYTIYARFNGDDNYNPSEEYNISFSVVKVDSNLTIKADDVDWANNVTVNITTDSRFTGNITVKLGDEEKIAEIKDGSGSVSFANLKADTYNVTAKFNETDLFVASQKDINVTVNNVNVTFNLDDIVFDWNKTGSTAVSYSGATDVEAVIVETGAVVLIQDNAITVSNLKAGTYTLRVTATPDENHTQTTKTISIKVNKVNSTLTLGDDIIFNYTQSGSTTVSFTGATNVEAVVVGHQASVENKDGIITVSNLDAGDYTLNVTTQPDENHTAISKTVNIKVNKVDSEINIMNDVIYDYGNVGQCSVFSEGVINFTAVIVGHPEANITIANGIVNVSGLKVGNYTLRVTANPDNNHKSIFRECNVTVNMAEVSADQALNITAPADSQSPTFSINLDSGAEGNFTVYVDGKEWGTVKVVNGSASITVANLPEGNHNITTSYSGDNNHAPIVQNTTLAITAPAKAPDTNVPAKTPAKVTPKTTKIVAKKKTFKAKVKVKKYTITLKSGKTLLKNVKVTLKVKGKTYKATTNKKGKATFKIKNLKKKGTYKAVIKFKGNKNYKASSKKVKIKVKK